MTITAVINVQFAMNGIPDGLLDKLNSDPFYDHCCLRHIGTCDGDGGVQYHHHLIYAGQQVSEKFCILPLCPHHHQMIHLPKAKWHADKIMLERATEEQMDEYELHDLQEKLDNMDTPWQEATTNES